MAEVRKMDFGIRIQNLRKEKGLSQEALAQQLGVSRQAVSKWETGEGYPEMDKIILLSDLFQVSLDYLIKDQSEPKTSDDNNTYFMNSQKIKEYMNLKKRQAFLTAFSVALIILSVTLPVLSDGTKYDNLGAFSMLVVVALAVALLIYTHMSLEHYMQVEKKNIQISFNDLQDLQSKQIHFKSIFGIVIALGVCLIILSTAFIVLIEDRYDQLARAQLFVSVAIAVFMFIYFGIKDSMYRFLVQNKEYIKKEKDEESSLASITMPLAVIVYLILGFVYEAWHPGWIIFPIVALLTSAIDKMLRR